jgi:hypothetical protein
MKAGSQVGVLVEARSSVWSREIVERAIFWLFVGALAWVPLWYGSNDWIAWGINAIVFPGLTVVFEISLLSRQKPHPIGIASLYLPVILFAASALWVVIQTLTPAWSPLVNPIWEMAAEALGHPVDGSISVNRDLTNLALVRLLTAASVFWLALQLCRDSARATALVASIGIIGCGYAAYGIIASKTGHLPWLSYLPPGGTYVSSTFIHRDCYATYAGIGFITMLGLVLKRYWDEIGRSAGSLRLVIASIIEASSGAGAGALAGAFLTLVALLLTASRGGILATVFGLFVLILLTRGRRNNQRPGQFAVIIVTLVMIASIFLVFGGLIADKMEENGIYDAGRMAVYLLTLRPIANAILQGYGYGTFVDVFPLYRDRSIGVFGTWSQANNTYLEVLQGLGVVFGSILIACVVLLAVRCLKGAVQRRRDAIIPGVAASVAVLVGFNALVDFGLQMQATAITFMAILGAGVAQSQSSRLTLHD